MNTGYLAAFATLFAWTISSFVLAKLSRLVDPSILNKAALFFSIFLLGLLVCILDHIAPWQLFTGANASNWFWLGLSGILGKSIGDYCGFCSMRILGVRRRSMITTLGPGFTLLFGWIILQEEMNWLGIAAMLLTTISLLFLINSSAEKEEVKNEKFGLPLPGLLYGIASAALTGLAFILSKKTFIETGSKLSVFHATWIRILVAFVAIMLVDVIRKKTSAFYYTFYCRAAESRFAFFNYPVRRGTWTFIFIAGYNPDECRCCLYHFCNASCNGYRNECINTQKEINPEKLGIFNIGNCRCHSVNLERQFN